MTHHIEVENIQCGGCRNSIKTALLKIENTFEVVIDEETNTISVLSGGERALYVAALSKLGYPEKGHNSLLHKGKSIVSCAVGTLTK